MGRGSIDRRQFLLRGAALGCCAAASPWLAPVALASAPWHSRLVVIILRGGMDGLDAVQPYGDPALPGLRAGGLVPGEAGGAADLDGFYALHPGLADLLPLWRSGELAFAHAVSTPYRDKRSHFDGQDLLEAGTGFFPGDPAPREGWLNRMLQSVPGMHAETAFAVGQEELLVLKGAAPVSNWSPGSGYRLSPQGQQLLEFVYEADPVFHAAMNEAAGLMAESRADGVSADGDADMEAMARLMQTAGGKGGGGHLKVAEFVVNRLRGETRVAAFSLNGWDTHLNQKAGLTRALRNLSDTILALKTGLGPIWARTSVLAMTEFGRTARENGTRGTDHGTGGVMLLAGGAVRGGIVHGRWPGLAEGDLYAGRDLMPTEDVRAYAAATMHELLGIPRAVLERTVFPGLDMGNVSGVIA